MSIEHLIAFNIALIAAIASPGPAMLVAIQTSLSAGRTAGVATGLGLGVMAVTWTLMALQGLETIFQLFPWALAAAKIIGALYLIYIAVKTWTNANKPVGHTTKPAKSAFLNGLLINLFNPKAMLFAAALLIVVFPPGLTTAEKSLIIINHLTLELLFYTSLALAMTTQTVSRRYLKAKPYLDRTAALILTALGLRLLVSNR